MWKYPPLKRAGQTSSRIFHGPQIIPTFRSRSTYVEPIQKDPAELHQTQTLPNGIRVATEALPGHFSGVGVFIDAGSRYENEHLMGVSHIMDRLAFKSTKHRTSDQMLEAVESLGGNINCASSRESLMYQSATFNSTVETTVALLAETIRDPLITEAEVQEQLETASYEIGEIWSKPELILPELVHTAAYRGNTLGNPLLCPKERIPLIKKRTIEDYRKVFLHPERIVLAFVGVQHGEAVKLAQKYFDMPSSQRTPPKEAENSQDGLKTPSKKSPKILDLLLNNLAPTEDNSSALLPPLSPARQPSHYTGGFLSLPNLPVPVQPTHLPLTHIHVAFESLPVSSEDIYALATLQTLLGGGGSFSAGGPGKGMYSRLYTNVLNRHGWVESCVAFNHSYVDSGLFGISASCAPSYVALMLDTICRQLSYLTLETGPCLREEEVNRAKNQLRSSLLMNLESRMVELEDLGRQVQIFGKKVSVREMCRKIDQLTVADLRRVAKRVLEGNIQNPGKGSGAPTVVLQESDDKSGRQKSYAWESIQDCIAHWKLGRR
ncbi:Mitochondrial-processing peptidase subunit alpha [Podosphaera aphanis]|nr:Mitochondrial-processing peptidase subunit alpha [Podosphaera aphanis]